MCVCVRGCVCACECRCGREREGDDVRGEGGERWRENLGESGEWPCSR